MKRCPRKRVRTIDEIFHMRLPSATDRVPSKRTRLIDERVFSGSLLKFRKCSRFCEQEYRQTRSHVCSGKPGIAYRPGLADTNGERSLRNPMKERRFHAPRTNAREKGWTLSSIFPVSRSMPNGAEWRAVFRRALVVKCVRTGASYFSRGPKLGIFDLEDHVSPQRKYTFNHEEHTRGRAVAERFPSGSVISRFLSLGSSSFRALTSTSTSTARLHGPRGVTTWRGGLFVYYLQRCIARDCPYTRRT